RDLSDRSVAPGGLLAVFPPGHPLGDFLASAVRSFPLALRLLAEELAPQDGLGLTPRAKFLAFLMLDELFNRGREGVGPPPRGLSRRLRLGLGGRFALRQERDDTWGILPGRLEGARWILA